jgi:uncharacterized membrane protein HdeD (DUF308 family)
VSSQLAVQFLGYVCGLGGLAGIAAYIWVVLRRRRWLNSAGLLLTALGLMQLSLLIHQNLGLSGLIQAAMAVALLLAAVVVQIIAAVRARTPWDGVDRRGGEA